jgi:thiol-disulfide isomerase/thioredoxin
LISAFVGRVVFVGQWFSVYQDDPWSIFDIRDGGFEPWSSAVAALLMAGWRVRQSPVLLRPLVAGLSVGLTVWGFLLAGGLTGSPPAQSIPTLTLTGVDGIPRSLVSAANGRPMVVNMWATWCPPCQREMPALARAQKLHPDIEFVFVNQGESLDVVRRYLRMVPFQLEHVLVDEGNLLGKALESTALPMTLIYGTDGLLKYSHQGLISEAVLTVQLKRCCDQAKTIGVTNLPLRDTRTSPSIMGVQDSGLSGTLANKRTSWSTPFASMLRPWPL